MSLAKSTVSGCNVVGLQPVSNSDNETLKSLAKRFSKVAVAYIQEAVPQDTMESGS